MSGKSNVKQGKRQRLKTKLEKARSTALLFWPCAIQEGREREREKKEIERTKTK